MESKWLTGREAAAYLRVNHRTLLLWARQGKIPAHRLSGIRRCVWRFLRPELDAMLWARHPLTLLREAAIESTATRKRVCALRQTAQDLELPLV